MSGLWLCRCGVPLDWIGSLVKVLLKHDFNGTTTSNLMLATLWFGLVFFFPSLVFFFFF